MHASTKWVVRLLAVTAATVAGIGVSGYPMPLSREAHLLLHILGAILLSGNIIVTAAWVLMAERTRDATVLRFAVRAANWADAFFTVPGVFLLVANGDILARQWGGVFQTGWLALSLAVFAVGGIIWMGLLIRYQQRLIVLSEPSWGEGLSPEFFTTLHQWYLGGTAATLLPLISLGLMVWKPELW